MKSILTAFALLAACFFLSTPADAKHSGKTAKTKANPVLLACKAAATTSCKGDAKCVRTSTGKCLLKALKCFRQCRKNTATMRFASADARRTYIRNCTRDCTRTSPKK